MCLCEVTKGTHFWFLEVCGAVCIFTSARQLCWSLKWKIKAWKQMWRGLFENVKVCTKIIAPVSLMWLTVNAR